jgi:hypothetical protein
MKGIQKSYKNCISAIVKPIRVGSGSGVVPM